MTAQGETEAPATAAWRIKTLLRTEEGAALRMRLPDRLSEPPPGLGERSLSDD
jgi:hypothetical protein